MKYLRIKGAMTLSLLAAMASVAVAADKEAQKDKIENRAEAKKDQIDKNADRSKDKVDSDADRAKDRVDGKVVNGDKRANNNKGDTAEVITDAWITTKIKGSFINDDALSGAEIVVNTDKDGAVVLTGTAPSIASRLRAGTVAAGIKGVRSVRNDIRVVPSKNGAAAKAVNGDKDVATGEAAQEGTDAWITTKIKASFVNEDALAGAEIVVNTDRKGAVVLTGTAPTKASRLRAAAIAKGIKGVRSVRNSIRVVPAKNQADGKVVGQDTGATGTKGGVTEEITDAWITTKIKASFIKDDALTGAEMVVNTEKDGVVILTGTAPTSASRMRAGTVAAGIKGVRSVRNEIRVVPAKK